MAPTDSPAPSLIERVQAFVSDNRRAVLIGTAAAAIAVGGAAVYYASTSSQWSTTTTTSTDGVDSDRRSSKKKKKGSKARKEPKDKPEDSPLLEAVEPQGSPKPDEDGAGIPFILSVRTKSGFTVIEEATLSVEEIMAMSEEVRS
jgi:import receptor subunit TOM70